MLTAGWGGLSTDEVYCANIVESPSWAQMFEYIKQDGNAPLIYVILRLWAMVFGFNDLSYRIVALILSTSIVPVAYLLFRDWLGKVKAAQVAVLFSLCAPLIHYSTLARGYGLLPILALVCTYQVTRLLDEGINIKRSLLYILTLTSSVYLHHWGAVMGLGHLALALIGVRKGWWDWKRFRQWFTLATISAILYAPWAVILFYQLRSDVSPWILRPKWDEILFYTAVYALADKKEKPPWARFLNTSWSNLLFWTSLVKPVTLPSNPPLRSSRWQIITFAGLAMAALISQVRSLWRDRYLTTFTPMLLVLQSIVIGDIAERLIDRYFGKQRQASPVFFHWLIIALPVLLWLPCWIPQLIYMHTYPESSAWVLAEQIGKQVNPRKDLVVVTFETIAPPMDRYLPKDTPMIAYPDMERVRVIRWAGINARTRDQNRLYELLDKIAETLDKGGDVWIVESVHDYRPAPLDTTFEGVNFNFVQSWRMCQIRTWLLEHAKKDPQDLWAPGREFPIMASRFSLNLKGSNQPLH